MREDNEDSDEVYFTTPPSHMPTKTTYKLVQEELFNMSNIIKTNPESDFAKCKNALTAAKPIELHVPNTIVSLHKAIGFISNKKSQES